MEMDWIADTDGTSCAEAVVANQAALRSAEATELALAGRWADLHGVTEETVGPVLPGSERFRRIGGQGTPEVGEFAAAELACLLGRSIAAATALMADALDLRHRLPGLWQAVLEGRARAWQAREVARRTRSVGLTRAQAQWVEAATTPYLPTLPWTRFIALVEAKIVEVDPEAAERRREAAMLERFVVTGRCEELGLQTIIARASAGDATCFVAMCDRIAEVLAAQGDDDPLPVRRSKALGVIANPARAYALLAQHAAGAAGPTPTPTAPTEPTEMTGDPTPFTVPTTPPLDPDALLPRAVLYLHLARESLDAARAGESAGVARMEGVGPITVEQCREFLAHTRVTVRPVIDLDEDHPVDGYEVPGWLRERVRLRSPAQVFPYAGPATRATDIDHTAPYLPPARGGPPGQTAIGNLGPLGRRAHRVKTHAPGWVHRQPRPGVHLWRTPHGHWFRVDPTGTHRLGNRPYLTALDLLEDLLDDAGSTPSRLETAFAELISAA